jgi:hypothetical protein
MKRTILATCTAAALGLAMTASAQQPPQPSQPTPPAQAAAATMDKEMKLTGCLKAGSGAGAFELATGKKDKAAPADQAAAAPGAPAPAQDAMARAASKNVMLAPAAGVELAPHLNHQIEVAGSWDKPLADAAAAPTAKKTFNVTAVKMIAASCTSGTS